MTTEFEKRDPAQYIGSEPELASETIPRGMRPEDQRAAAHSTQSGPASQPEPSGHREGSSTDDDAGREAGQNR